MVGSVLKPIVESTVIRVQFSVNPEEQVAMPKLTRRGHKKKQQNKKKELIGAQQLTLGKLQIPIVI